MNLVSPLESPIPIHPLEQASANYSLLPVLVNEPLWGAQPHSPTCVLPMADFYATMAELRE